MNYNQDNSVASSAWSGAKDKEKLKRGYRACLHCRSRKAKCDLGDIDAPSEPPCSRCKRESRECVFAPSRRGGNNSRRKRESSTPQSGDFNSRSGAPLNDIIHQSPMKNPYNLLSPQNSNGRMHEESASPKRRRLHLNPPLHDSDPSSIVVADMQNESDALHILAIASQTGGKGNKGKRGGEVHLRDFPLIKLGILDVAQCNQLSEVFFRCHHHLFPMAPAGVIPRSPEQLAIFASNERYLLTAIIIIASRNDISLRNVHNQAWAVFRGWLSDIECLGAPPTVGLVEALLLLAENLPRDPMRSADPHLHAIGYGEEVHGAENRQSWMLIGAAIRSAYGLGLDKIALRLYDESERTFEVERARLAWTYCYLFDRHVSLRLGLAFWSRGPAICFQGYSGSSQTGPAAAIGNFPFLREMDNPRQEDLASLVQAYMELTQLMSNAHDCLYPNAARTRSLVMHGEYFKYLDELARSLDGFKILWRDKKWSVFPLTDAVWAMFYYVQLYICAFSFQAHVERAAIRAEEEYSKLDQKTPRPPLSLFPRGAAASPDARYIFQSCDAARTLLRICVDSFAPGGALPFLPSRYLLWFTYAAIVLLKAVHSGAMLRADHAETLRLIDRLCACLAASSSDEEHPAVRYGRQLEGLKKKLAAVGDPGSPTGGHSMPIPTSTSPNWTFPAPPTQPPQVSFAYTVPPLQPLSDVGNIYPEAVSQNSLGFNQLADWFAGPTPAETVDEGFGAIDLQDFWMKVGPGEAQGGFPFR